MTVLNNLSVCIKQKFGEIGDDEDFLNTEETGHELKLLTNNLLILNTFFNNITVREV